MNSAPLKTLVVQTLFICFSLHTQAQKLSPTTQNLANKLAAGNVMAPGTWDSRYAKGKDLINHNQYVAYRALCDSADVSELLQLLNHPNSAVKGYAGWALAERKYPACDSIFTLFLESEEKVQDAINTEKVDLSVEFYFGVYYSNWKEQKTKQDSLFASAMIKKLDSIMLYFPRPALLLPVALDHNNANPATYEQVRKWAAQYKNEKAFIELARYNKQADIELLKQSGKAIIQSVALFPDEQLWPALEPYCSQQKTPELFNAVAAFKNERSANTLTGYYAHIHSIKRIEKLYEAIVKYHCPYYNKLLEAIWNKYKTIDIRGATALAKADPQNAAALFTKGLLNKKTFNVPFFMDGKYSGAQTLLLLFDTISVYNKQQIANVIGFTLNRDEGFLLSFFLNYIQKNNIQGVENALVHKLSRPQRLDSYAELYALLKVILSYRNQTLNQQVIKILQAHKRSRDWQYDKKEILEILKTFDIVL